MSGKTDELKGRAKEATGALADDDDLKREGKADRAAGTAKDTLDRAKDWASDKVDDAKNKVDDH